MPTAFPLHYEASLEAGYGEGVVSAGNRPPLLVGAPPEFDGRADVWSPEHLLLSALALCHYTTFHAFARRAGLEVMGYHSDVRGSLVKGKEGLAWSGLELEVTVEVREESAAHAQELLETAKRRCLIANSLNVPVGLRSSVRIAA